jgi:putative transposase
MSRPLRAAIGGIVYHVLNRANARMTIFDADGDYAAFEDILDAARQRTGTRLLTYCAMPNHWHLVVWPRADGELSEFVRWLTLTHTQRWHAYRGTTGSGHLYQGRFKSVPVQSDEHLLTLCRYVERNPLRAGLVRRAEDWRWNGLWRRAHGDDAARAMLSRWPIAPPRDWRRLVNQPQTDAELAALREAVQRGQPFGGERWKQRTVKELGLESTVRPRGRPRKGS